MYTSKIVIIASYFKVDQNPSPLRSLVLENKNTDLDIDGWNDKCIQQIRSLLVLKIQLVLVKKQGVVTLPFQVIKSSFLFLIRPGWKV